MKKNQKQKKRKELRNAKFRKTREQEEWRNYITIATLTGENGILTKASDAKEDTVIAQDEEMIKLEILRKL